jgi:hypothetical protein
MGDSRPNCRVCVWVNNPQYYDTGTHTVTWMQVDVNANQVLERKADLRGRVNLGMEYRNKRVELVIVEVKENDQ